MSKRHQITVIGAGYVGLSLAVLLSQRHDVTVLEDVRLKVFTTQLFGVN